MKIKNFAIKGKKILALNLVLVSLGIPTFTDAECTIKESISTKLDNLIMNYDIDINNLNYKINVKLNSKIKPLYYEYIFDDNSVISNSNTYTFPYKPDNIYVIVYGENQCYEKVKCDIFAKKEIVSDDTFVRVIDYIPSIYVDLKYASTDNFMKQKIYYFHDAYLRYGVVKQLMKAQDMLLKMGYSIKIFDAYRPYTCQETMYEIYRDSRFVASPDRGGSPHNKGCAIDMTIVNKNTGIEVEMPSKFDEFSKLAYRDYKLCTDQAKKNSLIMEKVMKKCDFIPYMYEWWHFKSEKKYRIEKDFLINDDYINVK